MHTQIVKARVSWAAWTPRFTMYTSGQHSDSMSSLDASNTQKFDQKIDFGETFFQHPGTCRVRPGNLSALGLGVWPSWVLAGQWQLVAGKARVAMPIQPAFFKTWRSAPA